MAGLRINKSSGGLVAGLRGNPSMRQLFMGWYNGMPFRTTAGYADLKQQLAEQRLISVDLAKEEYHALL